MSVFSSVDPEGSLAQHATHVPVRWSKKDLLAEEEESSSISQFHNDVYIKASSGIQAVRVLKFSCCWSVGHNVDDVWVHLTFHFHGLIRQMSDTVHLLFP